MTKITINRVFDFGRIAGKKAAEELMPFIDYNNQFTDNMISIINRGIGVSDNMDGVYKEVSLVHDTPLNITLPKRPKRIILAQCPTSSMNTAFGWDFVADFTVSIRAKFDGAPTTPVLVRLEIQNS